jgi:hypothetical protein
MKSHGVFINDKIYLVSDLIINKTNNNMIDDLITNLNKIKLFHKLTSTNIINSEDNNIVYACNEIKPVFNSVNYQNEFLERAIITRNSHMHNRLDFIPLNAILLILNEYKSMFTNNENNVNVLIHGDYRNNNVINGKIIDFDHVRINEEIEYDYARCLTNEVILPIKLINEIKDQYLSEISNEKFWSNYFHQNITLAGYSYALEDQELFKKWKKVKKLRKKKKEIPEHYLKLSSTEQFSGDVLEETAKILRTQKQHLIKTTEKFLAILKQ